MDRSSGRRVCATTHYTQGLHFFKDKVLEGVSLIVRAEVLLEVL